MRIRRLVVCAGCSLAFLALAAAPKPDGESALPYRTNDQGHALVTKDVMMQLIAKEVALRRKLAEPRYYKDVQGDVQEILRELKTDPFDGHPGRVDDSLPERERDEVWYLYQTYSAYLKTSGMRKQLVGLVGTYDGHGMFRFAARVERAKDFYKSDRMKALLHDLKLFNAAFTQLDRTVSKEYAAGERYGHSFSQPVTLSDLFNAQSIYGGYVNEEGKPKSSFWNGLTVLMRYNERMCDDELKKMKESAAVVSALLVKFMDARQGAVTATQKSLPGRLHLISEIVELDERIADCINLALQEFEGAVRKFENTDSDEFQLRSGLPCARVFAQTDVETDRPKGPDYQKLVLKSYFYLKDTFDAISRKRYGRPIPIK